MLKHRRLNLLLVLVVVAALAAPMFSSTVEAQAAKKLNYYSGKGDIPTIDPGLVTDTSSHQISIVTAPPLVVSDEVDLNKVQANVAAKPTVSKDGLTYTFKLRTDVYWVMWDGKAVVKAKDDAGKELKVTAKDFEYGIKRLLDPRTASEYAYVFVDSLGIKGGSEFNGADVKKVSADALNKLRDAVGVTAKDDTTLDVTIKEQIGYAVNIMALSNFVATPKSAIDKFGDKWTEPGNALSYGPYVVSEWKHDASMTIVKNPFWPGTEGSPKPKIDQIAFQFLDDAATFNNYEAGTLDVSPAPLPELDRIKSDPKLSKELTIKLSPSTYYYGFNVTKAPFDNVHMRRAFSYAVDRKAIVENVTKGGQVPARWFSVPGITAAPTLENSSKLGISYDPEMAKKELKAYLDEKKITADQVPPITLSTNQVEGHVKIAEAIQQMWQETLGVKVELSTQEWKVYLKTLQTDSPQVWRLGWNFDYPDANNFVRDVFRSTSSQNYTKWKNADFDKLVDEAAKLTDNAKRLALYQKAEDILIVKEAAIIPIYWYTRVTLTKPYVQRTFAQGDGDQRFEKWDVTKK